MSLCSDIQARHFLQITQHTIRMCGGDINGVWASSIVRRQRVGTNSFASLRAWQASCSLMAKPARLGSGCRSCFGWLNLRLLSGNCPWCLFSELMSHYKPPFFSADSALVSQGRVHMLAFRSLSFMEIKNADTRIHDQKSRECIPENINYSTSCNLNICSCVLKSRDTTLVMVFPIVIYGCELD